MIYARDGENLVQAAAYGAKHEGAGMIKNPLVLRIGEGIVGSAAACSATQLVYDTRSDRRYIDDIYPGLSELCVPIVRDGELLGVIDTEATRKTVPSEILERLAQQKPIPGVIRAEDLTGAALFFASDDARFVTGQVLVIDGGRHMPA